MSDSINNAARMHTPGPWELNGWGLIYGPAGPDAEEAPLVCDVAQDGVGIATDEEWANGCLIEAAPDLLAAAESPALDLAHDRLSELLDDSDAGNDEIRDAALDVCEALAEHFDKRHRALAKAIRAFRGQEKPL